jgi:hypothetical protein
MSGPPYPHPSPAPGSNAIGSFEIGVSPIGTISPFDVYATIINQYANSQILTGIITAFSAAMDLTEPFDEFYDNVWNILTAKGWGLDVWGRILGVRRTFQQIPTTRNFGYQEATVANADPFNVSPFYDGPSLTGAFSLDDDTYRALLLAKAAFNNTDCSIPSINTIMLSLFPNRGNCYVTDDGNMTMTYTFKFPITAQELAMLAQSGILPKPTGVKATIVQI